MNLGTGTLEECSTMPEPIKIKAGAKASIADARTAIASRRVAFGLAAPPGESVEGQGVSGHWVVCPWCGSPRWLKSDEIADLDTERRTLVICGACGHPFFAE
jgi:hypothetical protein